MISRPAGTNSDHLAIANQGSGAQQISTSGTNVLYGGTPVGTFAGGNNLTPLVVTFNAASTLAAVQAVARDITFRTDAPLGLGPRYVAMSCGRQSGRWQHHGRQDRGGQSRPGGAEHPGVPGGRTQLNLVYGQSTTVTANVSNLTTGAVPTGTVTFENGGFLLGVVPLTGGSAGLTIGVLGAGTDTITAIYNGDTIDSASTASLTLTVSKAHLTVTADNLSKYQGVPNPPLTATITGFVGSDTAAVVSGAPTLEHHGDALERGRGLPDRRGPGHAVGGELRLPDAGQRQLHRELAGAGGHLGRVGERRADLRTDADVHDDGGGDGQPGGDAHRYGPVPDRRNEHRFARSPWSAGRPRA